MCDEARAIAALPVEGLVFGALAAGHALDLDALRRVADAAAPRAITFHRAFELAPDPVAALQTLSSVSAVDRVLTSAGEGAADARVARLAAWRSAAPWPALLFAAGTDPAAIEAGARAAFEVHVGRAAREGYTTSGPVRAALVAGVKAFAAAR
jgi:copper homeostasis protein